MLPLILLAASLVPSQLATTTCVDTGTTTATTQTQPVRGPDGTTAVLKVSTADDHSKNSHECNADYELVFVSPSGGRSKTVDFYAADGDWGRTLSLRLDGFSSDGKHVFGILTEGGKYPSSFLFDYDVTSDGAVQLVDLSMQFARILSLSCREALSVIGTLASGEVVLGLNSSMSCGSTNRWKIRTSGGKPQPLAPGDSVLGLI